MTELYRVAFKLSENCLNHITNFGGLPRSEYLDLIIDAEDEIKRYLDDVENLNFEIIEKGSCRGPEMMLWYALETYVVYRTKPGIIREVLRKIALFFAKKFQYSPLKKNEKAFIYF